MHILLVFVAVLPLIVAQMPPYNCLLPVQVGVCKAGIRNYFYNQTSGQCEAFVYGGCGGNDNRFQSMRQCQRRCSCQLSPDAGPCKASMNRWYYDKKNGCCEKFIFGGCAGNGNNFESQAACKKTCDWSVSGKIKPYGIEWGSGYDRTIHGEIAYGNYGKSYGGSGTIWIHNDANYKNIPIKNKEILRIISKTGKRQVPGVQTKVHVDLLYGNGKSPEGSIKKMTGGSWQTSQVSGSSGTMQGGGAARGGSMSSSSGTMNAGGSGGKAWQNYQVGAVGGGNGGQWSSLSGGDRTGSSLSGSAGQHWSTGAVGLGSPQTNSANFGAASFQRQWKK